MNICCYIAQSTLYCFDDINKFDSNIEIVRNFVEVAIIFISICTPCVASTNTSSTLPTSMCCCYQHLIHSGNIHVLLLTKSNPLMQHPYPCVATANSSSTLPSSMCCCYQLVIHFAIIHVLLLLIPHPLCLHTCVAATNSSSTLPSSACCCYQLLIHFAIIRMWLLPTLHPLCHHPCVVATNSSSTLRTSQTSVQKIELTVFSVILMPDL